MTAIARDDHICEQVPHDAALFRLFHRDEIHVPGVFVTVSAAASRRQAAVGKDHLRPWPDGFWRSPFIDELILVSAPVQRPEQWNRVAVLASPHLDCLHSSSQLPRGTASDLESLCSPSVRSAGQRGERLRHRGPVEAVVDDLPHRHRACRRSHANGGLASYSLLDLTITTLVARDGTIHQLLALEAIVLAASSRSRSKSHFRPGCGGRPRPPRGPGVPGRRRARRGRRKWR